MVHEISNHAMPKGLAPIRSPKLSASLAAGALLLWSLAVQAQTTPTTPESTPSSSASAAPANEGLAEIVVTARYQTENLQTTPLAVTAVSAEQLKAANVTNVTSLGTLVPNLYTHPGDADEGGAPTIVMRGVVENDSGYAREPAVGIYIDDVYHSTVVGSAINLTDIDHVDVLRGPQGTLQGNASIGGSINIYSKLPTGDDSGYLSAMYGSFNKVQFDGAFDTTIAPNLYMRVSGTSEHQDGFVNILDFTCEMGLQGTPQLAGKLPISQPGSYERGCVTGHEGGTDDSSGKVMLRYVPTSDLEINYQVSYSKNNDEDSPELLVKTTDPYPNSNGLVQVYNNEITSLYGIPYDSRFLAPAGKPYSTYSTFCRPSFGGAVVQQLPYQPVPNSFCFPNSSVMDAFNTSLKVDYNITSDVHLKGIFAISDYSDQVMQNGDESPLGYVETYIVQPVKQVTGEVRLNGTLFNNSLVWVAGVYYLTSKAESNGFVGFVADDFTETDTAFKHTESGFVHAEYKITDAWSVSGGARYSRDKLEYEFDHPGLLVIPTPFTVAEDRVDWLASSNYQFTKDSMAYFTIATGSRPPGITTIVNTAQQLSPLPAEVMTSYEVGIKNEFFDHRLRFNSDVFYGDYSKRLIAEGGYQCLGQPGKATWVPLQSDCFGYANAASVPWSITSARPAKVEGFEFEITARPIDDVLVNWDGGYNNFRSSVTTPGQPGYIAPGNLIQPRWNMAGGVQYTYRFTAGAVSPRVDWSYQTAQTFEPSTTTRPTAEYTLPSRSIFNALVTYVPSDSKWQVNVGITNLTNKFYYYQLFTGAAIDISSNVAPPREYTVQVRRNF